MGKIKKKVKKVTEQFEEVMTEDWHDTSSIVDPDELIPTGSTIFNLECSGFIEGAFKLGKMVNLIGDSHAGKTLFALTVLAECSLLARFDNYRFIFDDVEAANEFNIAYLFGQTLANRIEYIRSKTIEEYGDNVSKFLEDDRPFIHILDSFDALTSEAAIAKDSENRKLREKGKESKGDYGDGKPKAFSRFCTQHIQDLHDHNSALIIISQTRDNIGFGAQFTPKIRSGGKALKFYAFHEVWLACEKKKKKGKRTIVTNTQAKITKNKLTGRHGEVRFPILFDYGVDNLTSCIRFLIDEGSWKGSSTLSGEGTVDTKGFYMFCKVTKGKGKKEKDKTTYVNPTYDQLIEHIEDNELEDTIFDMCQNAYNAVMEKLKPKRKRRYK